MHGTKNSRLVGLRRSLNGTGLTGFSGLTGFFVVKNACWFDKGVIGRRKFSNDKNPVNPVLLGFATKLGLATRRSEAMLR